MRFMTLLLCGLFVATGCSRNVGYVVKPVALEEGFSESVVQADPGLFVSDKIAVIDVDGILMNARDTGLFGTQENPVSEFVEKINYAQADMSVKAVILRINSPGGGVTASDIMHNRVMQFRAARKIPVISIIEDVGASGGYYVACAGESILAHPTSITGSIGVIAQTFSLAGTMKLLGVEAKAITTGKYKEMGSPLKPLDQDDQAIIQGLFDQYYARFLKVVSAGRPGLTADKIKTLADGRVYSGDQAKANGLVDSLGYMEDAVTLAKSKAGIQRCQVIMYHRSWGTRENMYSSSSGAASSTQMNLLNINVPGLASMAQPRFMYLWTGKN